MIPNAPIPDDVVDAILEGADPTTLVERMTGVGVKRRGLGWLDRSGWTEVHRAAWAQLHPSQRALSAAAFGRSQGRRDGLSRKLLCAAYEVSSEHYIRARRLRLTGAATAQVLVALGICSVLNRELPLAAQARAVTERKRRRDKAVRGAMVRRRTANATTPR